MKRLPRPLVATLAWAIAAAAALTPTASAATTGVLTGYALTTWAESEDGPFGAIAAIAQDADGSLWIGTSTGLFRFDGVRFTPWDRIGAMRLPVGAVTALLVARDGRLWVGIDCERIARRVNDFHLVQERLPEVGGEWCRVVASQAKEDGESWLRRPCAFISAGDLE